MAVTVDIDHFSYNRGENRIVQFYGGGGGQGISSDESTKPLQGWALMNQKSEGNVNVTLSAFIVNSQPVEVGAGNFEVHLEEAIPISKDIVGNFSPNIDNEDYLLNWNTAKSPDGRDVVLTKRTPSMHAEIVRESMYRVTLKYMASSEDLQVRIACN